MKTSPHRSDDMRMKPLAAAIVLVCGSGALAAHAQDRPVTLAPVVVEATVPQTPPGGEASSPKFTAPLLDTPQTVQVIPQAVFSQQGARNLTDVLSNTPGISFNAGENGFATNATNFQMRGFDMSGSIFIDGVRDSGSVNRDIFNLEQVEVVKGPAADNGRGGPGGYVNLVTKSPSLQNFNHATLGFGFDSYDSDNRLRATLDSNHRLTDGIAVRLNLLAEDGGMPGREIAERSSVGFAPSIAFGLNTDTRITLGYQHTKYDDVPDWGVPAAYIKGMNRYDPATRESNRDKFFGLASDYDRTEGNALTGRFEHDLAPHMTISNQLRWSKNARDARHTLATGYDPTTQMVTTQTQFYERTNENLSNLTNLTSHHQWGGKEHSLSLGLELTRDISKADRFGTANPGDTNIHNPNPHRAGAVAPAATQTAKVELDTVAVYAYDTVSLNERWQLTGGLRAEHYKVKIRSKTSAGAPQGPDGYELSDTTVGGKLGLVFKPAQNGSIYGSVGLASLPPGSYLSNPDISRTGDNAFPGLVGQNNEQAKTQQSLNLELGTKWELFDKRMLATAAIFHTERRNVAISGREPGETVTTLKGYGEQIVQGLELGLSGKITPVWEMFGGLLFMDSERKHSAFLDAVRREANPADYGTYTRTDGDELAFTPRFSASLWSTYRPMPALTLGAGIQHVGKSWLGRPDDADRIIPNGQFGKLPAYTVLNLMASYDISPDFTVRLNIDNVTDELYATSANWPGQRVDLGISRSYLLTANIKF